MKKILGLMFALLLLTVSVVVAEEECETKDDVRNDHLMVQYDFYKYRSEVILTRMDALIDHIGEGTEDLETIRDDFEALEKDALAAAEEGDKEAFNEVISQGRELVSQFKETSQGLVDDKEAAKEAIDAAAEENKEELDTLKNDALDAQLNMRYNIYAQSICHVTSFIEEKEIDDESVTEAVDTLEENYESFKDILSTAREECEGRIKDCDAESAEEANGLKDQLKEDLKAVREAIREAMKEAREAAKEERQADRAASIQTQLDNLIANAEKRIAAAEENGQDVTEAQEALDKVKAAYDEALTAYEEGDTESAKELLSDIKEIISEFRETRTANAANAKAVRAEGVRAAHRPSLANTDSDAEEEGNDDDSEEDEDESNNEEGDEE